MYVGRLPENAIFEEQFGAILESSGAKVERYRKQRAGAPRRSRRWRVFSITSQPMRGARSNEGQFAFLANIRESSVSTTVTPSPSCSFQNNDFVSVYLLPIRSPVNSSRRRKFLSTFRTCSLLLVFICYRLSNLKDCDAITLWLLLVLNELVVGRSANGNHNWLYWNSIAVTSSQFEKVASISSVPFSNYDGNSEKVNKIIKLTYLLARFRSRRDRLWKVAEPSNEIRISITSKLFIRSSA